MTKLDEFARLRIKLKHIVIHSLLLYPDPKKELPVIICYVLDELQERAEFRRAYSTSIFSVYKDWYLLSPLFVFEPSL